MWASKSLGFKVAEPCTSFLYEVVSYMFSTKLHRAYSRQSSASSLQVKLTSMAVLRLLSGIGIQKDMTFEVNASPAELAARPALVLRFLRVACRLR